MPTLDLDSPTIEENARLNAVAVEIRREFNELVEEVSAPHVDNLSWIVGTIASRNKYISPLFLRLCLLAFVDGELDRSGEIDEIVVADRALARVMRTNYRTRDRPIRVRCTEGLLDRFWRILKPIRQYLIATVLFTLRCLGRSKAAMQRIPRDAPITLIDTFVLNNKAGDEGSLVDGVYRDRYYPGLLENLTARERKDVLFMPTIVGFVNARRIFRQIRKAEVAFLVHDDFLKLSDYVYVLLHPLRLLRCRILRSEFRGHDVTRLLRQEKRNNCSDTGSLLGVLYYRFAARLAEQRVQVRLLIDWYENQVIDRGMVVGFHRFHPATKIVGYQGYVIARALHLYSCPNRTEMLGGAVPDVVSVVGEELKEGLSEFCPEVEVNTGPGFRFQRLWQPRTAFPEKDKYTVLVGLPIDLADSARVLQMVSSSIDPLEDQHVRFWIKPHPTWAPDRIERLLPAGWPDGFQFRIGDFHDVAERANLVITSGSSVGLEAIAKGIPVVIVGARVGIDQNPIPEEVPSEMWAMARTSEELGEAISGFRRIGETRAEDARQIGEDVRRAFFEPVTWESVHRFLDL